MSTPTWFRKRFRAVPPLPCRRRIPASLALVPLEERAAPAVLTVNSVADNTGPDTHLSLRVATRLVDGTLGRSLTAGEQAQVTGPLGDNDTIQFDLPSYPQTITLTNGALTVTNPVMINGPGADQLTVDGNNQDRVFVIGEIFTQDLNLVAAIRGLTITGGNQAYGSGLLNFGTLTVSSTTVSHNAATANGGGGIYNDGALTLTDSLVTQNTSHLGGSGSGPGGGLYNSSAATLIVSHCTFSRNTTTGSGSSASSGAGISNSGLLRVSNSLFDGNTASSDGGGIDNSGLLTIDTTTFSNNEAGSDGGAIWNGYMLTLTASTVVGSTASSNGGGIYSPGFFQIINSTIANNTAGSSGGGVEIASDGPSRLVNATVSGNRALAGTDGQFGGGIIDWGSLILHNTLVAGNFQGTGTTPNDIDGGDLKADSSHNLIGVGGSGGLIDGVKHNQVGVADPGLAPLGDYGGPTVTMALLPGSPAIDQGENRVLGPPLNLTTDQRGWPRLSGRRVDIGAFEFQEDAAGGTASDRVVAALTITLGATVSTSQAPLRADRVGAETNPRNAGAAGGAVEWAGLSKQPFSPEPASGNAAAAPGQRGSADGAGMPEDLLFAFYLSP